MLRLEIQARLAKDVSRRLLQTISDTSEAASLQLLSGDAVAVVLMQGNAYEDAIAWLQGIPRGGEDEYLLGLAYEATGQLRQARIHYEDARRLDSGNSVIQEALKRMR
jgi:tetratricopeptide (TPR) repeat protein